LEGGATLATADQGGFATLWRTKVDR